MGRPLIVLFILFAALAIFLARHPGRQQLDPSMSAKRPGERSTASTASPAASAPAQAAPIATPHATGAQAQAPDDANDSARPSAQAMFLGLLEKHSNTADWTLDLDENGRPFKMAGGKLKDVMTEGAQNAAFLRGIENALGFQAPAKYVRETRNTSRVSIVDLNQQFQLPNGEVLEVFGASLRLIGDSRGDAFLVYNELRPVNPTIRWASQLPANDALAAAKSYLRDDSYKLEIHQPAVVVFAHHEPHQKVTQVLAKNGPSTRVLFVGHDTRTVVWDQLMAFK
jgi:hypothetical protein